MPVWKPAAPSRWTEHLGHPDVRTSSSLRGPCRSVVERLERRVLLSANVLTYHNDNSRTGQNLNETTLTPANVNSTTFGQLFSDPVDGYVYAQPLYASNLAMGSQGTHNVVFVATENDSVYAFDADSDAGADSQPLWHDSFINPGAGITAVPSTDTGTGDIVPEVGITGTPVIDLSTNTLYVITNTKTVSNGNTTYQQQLHALNITTGAEKFGGPTTIQFSTPGTGTGSANGQINFDPLVQSERAALALANGSVYVTWASHGDNGPYHGLVAAYSASTLALQSVLNVTPDGAEGGIWMSGDGPAIDSNGNIFLTVGNGTFDAGGGDWGDSTLKITTSGALAVADSFTPYNQLSLDQSDTDFGSGGLVLLPTQPGATPNEAISGGKDGNLYLVNTANLGGFGASANTDIQTVDASDFGGIYDTPAYFNGTVYVNPNGQSLEAYPLSAGMLTGPSSSGPEAFGFPGATPSVSANGSTNGIVWEIEYGQNAVLRAFDATNVANELYNSEQAASRDQLGLGVKFAVPTVADGHVFVGTASSLAVFGLLSSGQTNPPTTPTNLVATAQTATDVHLSWNENSTNAQTFLIDRSTGGGPFVQIGSVAGTSTNYDDDSAIVGTSYSYEIEATNSAGNSAFSNSSAVSTPTVPGLVGYWQFNEGTGIDTADASGNSNMGTLSGEVTWIAGRVGPAALNFHGAGVQDAHVDIPDAPDLRFGQNDSFTLSAWVRANALDSKWAGIVTKSTDVAPGYGLYIDPNNHWAAATSSGINVIEGPLADTNWHLLTLVQSGTSGVRQFYVDGTLVGSGAAEDGSGTGDLWVGGSKSTVMEYFNGAVDDLRVYNTALSQAQVETLAQVPATPAPGTGAITGTVYEDPADTGIQPGADSVVAGDTVFLDLNDNGVLDPNEPISVTDSSGAYSFTNLADGTYRVVTVASNEEHITTPTQGYDDVTISGGQTVGGINFGQTPNDEVPPASQFSIQLLRKLPGAVLGGATQSVVVRVTNRSAVTFGAPLQLSLFVSTSSNLDNTAHVAAGPIYSRIVLRKDHSRDYTIHFKYPANLPAGPYYLIAAVTANKSVGETQALAVTPEPTTISPPFVSLTSSFRAKGAIAVRPGRNATALVSIANSGNVVADGTASVEIFASPDATLDSDDTRLKLVTRHIRIGARRANTFAVSFKAPPGLPGGSYYLITRVLANTTTADTNPVSDIAVMATRAR